MKSNPIHLVTYSEVETFRACPQKHHFRYRELLRTRSSGKVRIGSAYHRGVEVGVIEGHRLLASIGVSVEGAARWATERGTEAALAYIDETAEKLLDGAPSAQSEEGEREARDALPWMIEHYFRATMNDFSTLIPIAVEKVFEVPIDIAKKSRGGPVSHAGVIDLVFFDRVHRDIVLDDHKTVDTAPWLVESRVEIDPQMCGYIAAIRVLQRRGELRPLIPMAVSEEELQRAPTGRVIYSVMRRARPRPPTINQDGTVSIAACDTTADLFQAALEAQQEPEWLLKGREKGGSKLDDVEARWSTLRAKQQLQLERIQAQGDRYFTRIEHHRSDADVERWRREMVVEAARIRAADRDPTQRTRSPGTCTSPWSPPCEYRPVCRQDSPETRLLYRVAESAHEEIAARKVAENGIQQRGSDGQQRRDSGRREAQGQEGTEANREGEGHQGDAEEGAARTPVD